MVRVPTFRRGRVVLSIRTFRAHYCRFLLGFVGQQDSFEPTPNMTKRSDNPNAELSDQEEPQKKRVRLNLGQKMEAAQKLLSGMTTTAVAKEYGCSVRAMINIKRDAPRLLELNKEDAKSLYLKSVRAPKFPAIDTKLIEFVNFARVAKVPLSVAILKTRANSLRDELLKQDTMDEKMRSALESFSVSDGWVCNFRKRFGLRSLALRGQDGEADPAAISKGIAELRTTLHGYSVDCIYNVDETSLFYKLLPRRSYVTAHGDRTSVRNVKNMTSKDRITAYICANANGTRKVPLAIVGAMKNLPCFNNDTDPVSYFHQKSAWSDTATFRQWFQGVFLPFVREQTSNPVALVMGSCGPHGTDAIDSRGQVTILTLPHSCATVRLPMSTGITEAWKVGYRQELLKRLVANVEDREERRRLAANFKPGMKGISEGYYPSLLDVSEMILRSWDGISRERIALCWMETNILPAVIQAKLTSLHGQAKMDLTFKNSPLLKNIKSLLSHLIANLLPQDPMHAEVESVAQGQMETWLNLEEDQDISEAVINDLTEEIELSNFDEASGTAIDGNVLNSSADATNTCGTVYSIPKPGQIARMFKPLEELAIDTGILDAFVHLRKAKIALMEAYYEQSKRHRANEST